MPSSRLVAQISNCMVFCPPSPDLCLPKEIESRRDCSLNELMGGYDLGRLNDKEFEAVAMHMVGFLTGQRLERFKPGKDQGVDGRYFVDPGREVVIQAKHWEKTGINHLLRYLRDREVPKVIKLAPHRYIFVTSVPLSRADKQAITALFAPHLQAPSDIFGNYDIQDFLRDHTEVAQQHYKLWLCSADVLGMMLNAPIIGRSQFKMEEVLAFAPKYVATKCHDEATRRLDHLGSIIITGEPGIGKSTLAEQLVLNYAAKDYQVCVVHDDLRELEGIWAKDRRQVFYFDDFLGRNYLEAIEGNRDSAILAFMRRVQKDNSKRFILTSRTSILQQGKSLSELFREQNLDEKEFEVRVVDLTAFEKAHILYNHIWFGELSPEFVEQLYVQKRYKVIVAHRNFNPRLIAFITDSHKVAGVPAECYWDYVEAMLKNPRDIWQGFFENQLDAMGRLIVTLVAFHGGEITEPHLRAALERGRLQEIPPPSPPEWALTFERSFRMSVGAIITRNVERAGKDPVVGLFNPSVGDYIFRRYAADVASLERFLALLSDQNALVRFSRLHENKIVGPADYRAVLQRLAARFWPVTTENPVFCAALASLIIEVPELTGSLGLQIRTFAERFFAVFEASQVLAPLIPFAQFSLEKKLIAAEDPKWSEFVRKAMDDESSDEVLAQLSQVVELLNTQLHDELAPELAQHVLEVWKGKITVEINQSAVLADFTDPDTDYDEAHNALMNFVCQSLEEYAFEFERHEIEEIVNRVDIIEILIDNSDSGYDDESHGSYGGNASSGDAAQIDDLFERDQ